MLRFAYDSTSWIGSDAGWLCGLGDGRGTLCSIWCWFAGPSWGVSLPFERGISRRCFSIVVNCEYACVKAAIA
ncbi:hypothetical protein JCGZ_05357 [Jatropha curcas]|uniref:Uncharacterized protein n=1 Tax=Jatropha curcas TaxID=180498 RepID=A0A067KSD5_JATCU|nr:hypothetical protein JCGZ_05357 [Jatropha curcas]